MLTDFCGVAVFVDGRHKHPLLQSSHKKEKVEVRLKANACVRFRQNGFGFETHGKCLKVSSEVSL